MSTGYVQFQELENNEMALVIRGNGRVELSGFQVKRKGWLWARKSFLTRFTAGAISLDNFFNILARGSKQRVFEKLGETLAGEHQEIFQPMAEQTVHPVVKSTARYLRNIAETAVNEIVGNDNIYSETAAVLLREVSQKSLERFKHDLSAEITGSIRQVVSEAASKFKSQIAGCTQDESLAELPILPEGTKFVKRRGNRTVYVIEQKPQVRSLTFNVTFLDCQPELPKMPNAWLDADEEILVPLAFPYVIFILIFDDDHYVDCQCFYRNSPLEDLDDKLMRSNLPNILSGEVCMGYVGDNESITDIAHNVIAEFWGSKFNKDYRQDYETATSIDKRVSSLVAWKRASKRGPRFVLDVPWVEHMESLREVVEDNLSETGQSFDELTKDFTDEFEETLISAVTQAYERISTKGRYHKSIREKLGSSINKILVAVLGRVGQSAKEIELIVPTDLRKQMVDEIERTLFQTMTEKFVDLSRQTVMGRTVEADELIYGVNQRLIDQSVDLGRFGILFYPLHVK